MVKTKQKKISLSVQRLVLESFRFNGKNIGTVYVPGLGEYLIGIDVSREIGYVDDDNGRCAIKRHVLQKYMMRFEDVKDIVKRHVRAAVPQDYVILLKKTGIYCFLLRCKIPRAKPFMKWDVETVLPREVRELTSVIDEIDATIALVNDDLKNREYKNVSLQGEISAKDQQIAALPRRYVEYL